MLVKMIRVSRTSRYEIRSVHSDKIQNILEIAVHKLDVQFSSHRIIYNQHNMITQHTSSQHMGKGGTFSTGFSLYFGLCSTVRASLNSGRRWNFRITFL